jgi:hypothetical protein
MDHRLVGAVEKALGWPDASRLGGEFARGSLDDPGLGARLLTPTKLLDLIMRRSLSTPQLRCFCDGTELHPTRYITDTVGRRGQSIRIADMRRLGRLLHTGCTLVLDTLDFFDPTLEVACRALQWWSRELVQVNAYLTTQQASGFNLHWDDHDVIIVQLAGDKSWEVREPSRSFPLYRDAAPNLEPSNEIVWSGTLSAGEVMHIPRGYWHQATRNDHGAGYSLHLTFGFVKRTGVNWLSWLADHSREHDLFRRDLDRWATPEARTASDAEITAAAARFLTEHPPSDFLTAREREWEAARHVTTLGTFGVPSDVVCVTEFPPTLQEQGHEVVVLAAGKKITFTARAVPALRLLLSGHPVNLADATRTTGLNVSRLADVLCEEGICAELTAELSSGYTDLITTEGSLPPR